MSDEDATFEPPRAAIPSRAGVMPSGASGSLLPQPSPLPPVVEAPPRPRTRRVGKSPALAASFGKKKAKRNQRLPAAEIKRITKNRSKNLKKRAAKKAAPVAKNPNRPLELKNQMAAILATATKLTREELGGFMIAIETVGKLSRKGRAKVISALANTYGITL